LHQLHRILVVLCTIMSEFKDADTRKQITMNASG
jgi:hypothetical protein